MFTSIIVSRTQKLYLWFKRKFRIKMNPREIFDALIHIRNTAIDSLQTNIDKRKGYFNHNDIDNENTLENGLFVFTVGQYRFLLKFEINQYKGTILYTTFQLKPHAEQYPKIRYKQEQVESLTFSSGIDGMHEFEDTSKVTTGGYERVTNPIPVERFESHAVGRTYLEQVENYLKSL